MSLELFERFGSTEIIDCLKDIRKVTRVNTVGITLVNKEGKESQLDFVSAKLFEYTGDTVIVYKAGFRDLTEQEQSVLDKWIKIRDEYIKQNYSTYSLSLKEKDYFENCPCPWMSGLKTVRGKRYDGYLEKVKDYAVKDRPILKYHVHMET